MNIYKLKMSKPATAITLFGRENTIYLVISAILGAWGIVSDSSDALVGAMLVSPFFVPIINMFLKNGREKAWINNLSILGASILFCLLVGFATAKYLKLDQREDSRTMKRIANWSSVSKEKTTMAYVIPVFVGILIAVAYRNQNIIPMVGAGIAVSILPPFVNAGLYWGKGDKKNTVNSLKLGLVNTVLSGLSYSASITVLRKI